MHILRVSLGVSALATAAAVVYGYLFGLQSARDVVGSSDFFYFFIFAIAAGALAAILHSGVLRTG